MRFIHLSDICAINMGQSPDSSSYNVSGDGLPFFQGNADFGDKYPVARVWCSEPTKIAHAEDILISVRAPIGAMNYAKETCCIGRGLAALTPDKNRVSLEFVFWLLKGKNAELINKGTGSTFKAISRKVLEEVLIPDISLEQQTAFASQLETVYSIIQMRQRQLRVLDTLIKARFVEMFPHNTFPQVSLVDASIKGPQNGFYRKGAEVNGTIPIIKMKQLFANDCMETAHDCDLVSMTEKEIASFQLTKNDLLFGRRSLVVEGAGKCKRVGNVDRIMTFESSLLRVTLDYEKMRPRYVQTWLETNEGRSVISSIRAVTTIAGIKGSDLAKVKVPMAPISLQDQFITFAEQIDKSKVAVQAALEKAQLLFDSLMQQYFG